MGSLATSTYPATAKWSLNVFLFDGDSLSTGSGAGALYALDKLVSMQPNFSGRGRFSNVAIGGRSAAQMVVDFHRTKSFRTRKNHGLLFIWGGALVVGTTFSDLQSYWALARADGWEVVASTVLSQADDTPSETALRISVNSSIRSASSEWDYLLDVATVLTNPSDPLYFVDGVHCTPLGYQTIAEYINSTLNITTL